jgi:hypothetical protein
MTPKPTIVDLPGYGDVAATPPPPVITSDPLVTGVTPIEQLLAALGLAANAGDPADNGLAEKGHAERELKANDALAKFPANEAESQAKLNAVGQDGTQMAQQIPQMAAGMAGAVAGALGGALAPFGQAIQGFTQSAQGMLQQGMGALQQSAKAETLTPEALSASGLGDEFGGGAGDLGEAGGGSSSGGGGGGVGGGGTTPMSMLGPPATPTASTVPTSSRAMPPVPAPPTPPTTGQMGGMGGYPMMPPGAMHGAGGEGKDDKPGTKRVSVPSVKNGAPVQGRVSVPPTGPTVTKQVEGKTVATRRIVIPNDKNSEKADEDRSR